MRQRQITHQNIFRVLLGGFGVVMLLLLAAAVVGVRSIRSIQANAADIVREQADTNRLINELQHQETSVREVFSLLARHPESVNYTQVMGQLAEADSNINRITAEGAQTAERDLWGGLRQASLAFSAEARRLLSDDSTETYATVDLFRYHEAFVSVIGRLLAANYRKANAAQARMENRSSRLLQSSYLVASASVLLGLIFAVFTVRLVSFLIRRMEWQTAELARVSWHMLEDQEATARRFSHELHDELGQALTAIRTNLSALESGGQATPERLQDCRRLVDEAIGNVRQLSQLLRPVILDDFGLEAALRWLGEGFATRTGITVDFQSHFSGRLPDETETHLFRIAQEALTNVARHSGAKRVRMKLETRGEGICLSIEDDGRGLPAAASANGRGMGMIGMRARARSAGGDVSVKSRPGEGVLVEVRAPLLAGTKPDLASSGIGD
ncbi:MAG TPA: ATP-binding protein [Bryobacteraceae bacterium]|jgi:signal transduction histidine kinase|nr:ATP-binding protein [Bryobacteraceae bacterium]